MNTVELLQSGFLAALIAPHFASFHAGFFACAPWLPNFGWILLRYVLPPAVLVTVVLWCLFHR